MSGRTGSNGHGLLAANSNGEGSSHHHLPESSSSKSATNGHTNGHSLSATHEDQHIFRPLYEGSRLDRTEFVRIALQSLKELGYE